MSPALPAILSVILAFAWLYATARWNSAGNWTARFVTGSLAKPPQTAELRGTYVFPASFGYDGQYYRYVAHDPFFRRGLAAHIDSPRLRYRRVAVPLLAWAIALGEPSRVDAAYFAVILLSFASGVYWTARWARAHGRAVWWGMAFLAVPAAIVSLDRMTVDVALSALVCAWAVYAGEKLLSRKLEYAVLAAVPLVRETGLVVNAAAGIAALAAREWRRLLWLAAALVPCGAWYLFVDRHTLPEPLGIWFAHAPFAWLASTQAEPLDVPFRPVVLLLDYAALAGIGVAIVLAFALWWRKRRGALEMAAFGFALLAIQTGRNDVWAHVFSYGRVFSPLLLLLGLRALAGGPALLALPLALVLPRVLVQLVPQVQGVLRGLLG